MANERGHKKTGGSCLCGQVQFEIYGELRDIVNCHCSKCRKFHGNYGAYTSVKVETKDLKQASNQIYFKTINSVSIKRSRLQVLSYEAVNSGNKTITDFYGWYWYP